MHRGNESKGEKKKPKHTKGRTRSEAFQIDSGGCDKRGGSSQPLNGSVPTRRVVQEGIEKGEEEKMNWREEETKN